MVKQKRRQTFEPPDTNSEINQCKIEKTKCKSLFTRRRHQLLDSLYDPDITFSELKTIKNNVLDAYENVLSILAHLSDLYAKNADQANVEKTNKETEKIEEEFDRAESQFENFTSETRSVSDKAEHCNSPSPQHAIKAENKTNHDTSSHVPDISSHSHQSPSADTEGTQLHDDHTDNEIGRDMWKQLTRVSIPTFSGDKKTYGSWRAAFMACVDRAPATAEYKLLQLKKYLSGDPLRIIESLGHSALAYEAAKDTLDRKYGGTRRQVNLYLDELDQFRPIRPNMAKDVDRLADLVEVLIINLKEAGRTEELGNGSLYLKIQKKMTEGMITNYQRWKFENAKPECVETLRQWIVKEAEFQTVAAETLRGLTTKHRDGSHTLFGETATHSDRRQKALCKVCKKDSHPLWLCEDFKAMRIPQRWDEAKRVGACFRCLRCNHRGNECTAGRQCGVNGCRESHNRLLHREASSNSRNGSDARTEGRSSQSSQSAPGTEGEHQGSRQERTHTTTMKATESDSTNRVVALRTVPVEVVNGNRRLVINAILDDGSTKTYISSGVASQLGLHGEVRSVTVNMLSGQENSFQTMPVEFRLKSLDGRTDTTVSAFTVKKVTGDLCPVDWKSQSAKWKHLRGLPFPNLSPRPFVDMLIGIDHAELHYSLKDVRGNPGEPIARLTPLGWTCIGGAGEIENHSANFNVTFFVDQADKELNITLQKFWETETSGTTKRSKHTEEEMSAVTQIEESVKYKNGHYEVSIPWKENGHDLLNTCNYNTALKRLENTEKRLMRMPEWGKVYTDVIGTYLEKGYIRRVDSTETKPEKVWYLPHFPVIKPDRNTTKVRIVFDASVRCDGLSLNDVVLPGPKLQNDLFDILLRFRRNPIGIVCDISEMYLQIHLKPEDRPFHRFLWRNLETQKDPETYEWTRVVFGVSSSPFQAQFVSRKHAEDNRERFPQAAETVLESTYMDDSMDSTHTEAECIELYRQLSQLWGSAGMHARKWLSNSEEVLKKIPSEDRAIEVDLNKGNLPTIKTLGVTWVAKEDVFTFKVNAPDDQRPLTKRSFLATSASLFDPMGFLAPFMIRSKILLQELWTSAIDWDDTIESDHAVKVRKWFEELHQLSNLKIFRCLKLSLEVQSSSLHVFVDASGDAYGAAVYARHEYTNGQVSTRLVASKTRVAPLTPHSVPRLELMGAVIGLRLGLSVADVLKVDKTLLVFWSDSMNVLWWIRGRGRAFKPFIANRVGEIQTSTKPNQWRHVPTSKNPADLPTRGISVDDLARSLLWWNGPEFLELPESEWPKTRISPSPEAAKEIRRKARSIVHEVDDVKSDHVMIAIVEDKTWRLQPERYSSWQRLVRVRSWVRRFLNNCRMPVQLRCYGELKTQEISGAEVEIIAEAQQVSFPEEYKALTANKPISSSSKLLSLKPMLDDDGVLRSDGRLVHADYLPYDARFPIILPRKSWTTKLIVKTYHEKGNHQAGTNQTLASLSHRFWILQAREEIREWERECFGCRRRKAGCASQVMAPLPKIRLMLPLRAFGRVAVDYAGPFLTKQGRGMRRTKRYLCLFTCLLSRAVHLEMSYSMDTDSFLNAFFRMVNRRGRPLEVLSDNGSNFIGGERELRELVKKLDKEAIDRSAVNKGIQWHFNPPLAPHFGGVHETMIKAAKRATYATLSQADITDEELVTAFTGAEALINSRPLTYQSSHPSDDVPLTPNHFLFGQVGGEFAPESVDTTDFNLKIRWRRVQELVNHFWGRWLREWLPTLNRRAKWWHSKEDVKIDDVVLVLLPDSTRAHWPLGRVIDVYPGTDGHVRSVKVRVGKKVIVRPITKISPLELDCEPR